MYFSCVPARSHANNNKQYNNNTNATAPPPPRHPQGDGDASVENLRSLTVDDLTHELDVFGKVVAASAGNSDLFEDVAIREGPRTRR